jgi:hypothetical protein
MLTDNAQTWKEALESESSIHAPVSLVEQTVWQLKQIEQPKLLENGIPTR